MTAAGVEAGRVVHRAGGVDERRKPRPWRPSAPVRPCSTARSRTIASCCAPRPRRSRVVRLHDEQLRPTGDGVAHDVVVGDLEADHVTDGDRPDVQHARRRCRRTKSVRTRSTLSVISRANDAHRHVLGERHRVLLDVRAAVGPVTGLPRRGRRCAAVARPGPSSTPPTRIGTPIARGRGVDPAARVGVADRVDVAGVLRPHHQVGLLGPAGRDLGGQRERGVDVVVEHGPALGVELQPEPGHVALHDRDRDRPAVRCVPPVGSRAARDRRSAPPRRPRRPRRAGRRRRPDRGPAAAGADAPPGRPARAARRPRATANVTSGAPPSAASRSSGESPWLNASRPHGKPPNGVRSRSASCSTHSAR